MSGRVKDIDYLALSARIRGLIDTHLTGARMERFLAAKNDDEAQAVLTECGYPEFRLNDAVAMDKAIAEVEKATFDDMIDFAPDPAVIDVFRVPYDYHNCKALLKERATGVNADHMLMRNGRVDPETIRKAIQTTEIRLLPKTLSLALDEAWDVLDATDDPQLSEAVLDRATYAELREIADGTGSDFLKGYITLEIDSMNLRATVRALRMGKNADFLRNILVDGGEISADQIVGALQTGDARIAELYAPTHLKEAAIAGEQAVREGGSLAVFEKLGDDAEHDYLHDAVYMAFGDAVLIGYLAARQIEYRNVRIMLLGRDAGLSADEIRPRLRDAYV